MANSLPTSSAPASVALLSPGLPCSVPSQREVPWPNRDEVGRLKKADFWMTETRLSLR